MNGWIIKSNWICFLENEKASGIEEDVRGGAQSELSQ